MKLYQLNRGDKFTIDDSPVIVLGNLDGMYSYCWLESDPTQVIHIAAAAEVILIIDQPEQIEHQQ